MNVDILPVLFIVLVFLLMWVVYKFIDFIEKRKIEKYFKSKGKTVVKISPSAASLFKNKQLIKRLEKPVPTSVIFTFPLMELFNRSLNFHKVHFADGTTKQIILAEETKPFIRYRIYVDEASK